MGGSSKSDYAPPAGSTEGPLNPATSPAMAPPTLPSFLPNAPGVMATGLTPQMFSAISAYDAPQGPLQPAQGTSPPAATVTPEMAREALAKAVLAQSAINARAPMNRPGGRLPFDDKTGGFVRNPDYRPGPAMGGPGGPPGYTTSGPFGGPTSRDPMGGGLL